MCIACGDPAHAPSVDYTTPQFAGAETALAGGSIRFDDAAWQANYGALLYSKTGFLPRWNADAAKGTPVTLTYRFADTYPAYENLIANPATDFRSFPDELRAIAESAMRDVEKLTNVRFVLDTTSPVEAVQIVIMGSRFGGGVAYFPDKGPLGGDIVIGIGEKDGSLRVDSGIDVTGDGLWAGFRETFIHELGHALGLRHPRNYENGVPSANSDDYVVAILPAMDMKSQTVMSYLRDPAYGQNQWAQTFMPLDLLALQDLYGVNRSATAGDDRYVLRAANPGVRTLWDVGGIDTLDLSNMLDPASVDVRPAGVSSIGRVTHGTDGWYLKPAANNLVIGPNTVVENVVGTPFADTILGNDANNRLDGGKGIDTLIGGKGDDTYVADQSGDVIVEAPGEGTDTVLTDALVYELPTGTSVEILRALDPTSTAAQALRGNEGDQLIVGNAGDNILNGFGGSDTMAGLGGNDTYLVRSLGDRVIEANGEGYDTVFTTVSYNLGANEVEMLSTVVQGDTTKIDLIGNYATQLVIGNYGDNILNGGSGGDDTLIGLKGDDTYAVSSQSIRVVENAGEGNDTLVTSVDYRLSDGCSIEIFAAQIRDAATGLKMTGNEVSQLMAGTNAADVLDGRGGSDTIYGFGGDDVFVLSTKPVAGEFDTFADFGTGADRIGLASDVFAAVGTKVDASEFLVGTAAQTADQHLIYDQGSGQLFWDADGSGAAAAIKIAQVAAGTILSADSFLVIPTA